MGRKNSNTTNLLILTKEELYEYILKNTMRYSKTIKAFYKDFFKEVTSKYLDASKPAEAFWLYCKGYDETLKCSCGRKLLFENIVKGYKTKECKSCYEINRVKFSIVNTTLALQSNQPLPKCENPVCNGSNPDKKINNHRDVMLCSDGTWSNYCSIQCRGQGNSLLSRSKFTATNISKCGYPHFRQDPENLAEFNQIIKDKYGVDHIMDVPGASDKRDNTNTERYGFPCVFSSPVIQSAIRETNIERYGYPNVSQSPEIHTRKLKTSMKSKNYIFENEIIRLQGYEPYVIDHLRKSYNRKDFQFGCIPAHEYYLNGKGHTYHPDFLLYNIVCEVKSDYTLMVEYDINMAKFYAVASHSDLALFVKFEKFNTIYSTIRNNSVNKLALELRDIGFDEYIVLEKTFIDFYNPEKKIAIKIIDPRIHNDYLQSHTGFKDLELPDITYYYYSTYDLMHKYDIIISSIKNKILIETSYIHARKCQVQEITSIEAKNFFNLTHIQGFVASNKYIGLYYNSKLLSCMSFSVPRADNDKNAGAVVLSRFSSIGRINGAASKLLNYYIKTYSPTSIISFSNNMYSFGKLYKSLDFKLKIDRRPDYVYSKKESILLEHKTNYSDTKLKAMTDFNYTKEKGEKYTMIENNYVRLYNNGMKTWVLNITKGSK